MAVGAVQILNIKSGMDFIDEFIQEYKNNPCLWKADSVHFKNRTKRQEAYLKLIDVAARHGEHYNVERTKQKINNLRCAFRHQLKKYNEFKNKGEKDEPYCPKRRYFESLMFLKDEENPEKRINPSESIQETLKEVCSNNGNFNVEQKKLDERVTAPKEILQKSKNRVLVSSIKILETDDDRDILTTEVVPESEFLPSFTNNSVESQVYETDRDYLTVTNKPANNCRKRSSSLSSQHSNETENTKCLKVDFTASDFEKLLTLAHKGVQNNVDDHFANFGKVIAYKLRSMDTTQAMYAEKLISDVLFQGQMKLLSACRINQFLNFDESSKETMSKNK